jgi:hypothetical protein
MKKLALLASVLVAAAALAGCGPHPNDITDDVAAVAAPAAQA